MIFLHFSRFREDNSMSQVYWRSLLQGPLTGLMVVRIRFVLTQSRRRSLHSWSDQYSGPLVRWEITCGGTRCGASVSVTSSPGTYRERTSWPRVSGNQILKSNYHSSVETAGLRVRNTALEVSGGEGTS